MKKKISLAQVITAVEKDEDYDVIDMAIVLSPLQDFESITEVLLEQYPDVAVNEIAELISRRKEELFELIRDKLYNDSRLADAYAEALALSIKELKEPHYSC